MITILTCTIFGVFMCISFVLGAKIGQIVQRDKPIVIPSLNPVKMVKEHIENKKEKEEIEKLNTILDNIDNYDGTGNNQKEV